MEQRVLYDASPSKPGIQVGEQPLLPNCKIITRDRPHRFRSVQKGFWANAGSAVTKMLDSLVTGPRSVARLLETSSKFAVKFQQAQHEARNIHSAEAFAATIKNLQYSEARFDSRTRPLFRLFRLMPVVTEVLAELSADQDDAEDSAWAAELLESWGGDTGFSTLVQASVVADALVVSQPALRLEDKAAADWSLSGPVASELLQTLKHLLHDGGIFLEEAEGTLTHSCLRSIRGKMVYVRSGCANASAVALRWPSADNPARLAVVQKAKENLA